MPAPTRLNDPHEDHVPSDTYPDEHVCPTGKHLPMRYAYGIGQSILLMSGDSATVTGRNESGQCMVRLDDDLIVAVPYTRLRSF